jgi:hypothetical protein
MATNAHVMAAGALGLAVGLSAATLWWRADRPPAVPGPVPERAVAGPPPAAALAAEREARAALEAENATLRAALAGAGPPSPALAAPPGPATGAGPAAGGEPGAPSARPAFDADALAAAGLSDADIERLRERYAAFQLDELYLRDQARREGWLREHRFQRELRALRDGLREEIGDDAYDALLYATGQENRVVITQPIPGSPADQAGLQAGDALVYYGGLRIFDPYTLIAATAAGAPGQQTEVRIERQGEDLRVFVPRGPLGTTIQRDRRPPDNG